MSQRRKTYAFTRGIALFFGVFSLLNVLACLVGNGTNMNMWWIDLTQLSLDWEGNTYHFGFIVELLAGICMIVWAKQPACGYIRQFVTCILVALLAIFAATNAVSYWQTLASGQLYSASPIPLSLLLTLIFAWIAFRVATASNSYTGLIGGGVVLATCLAMALVFPLLQIGFFGTTDYRRDADTAVVFGARVYEDGTLSVALRERMDTAIELYKGGNVRTIICSGGIEDGGVDEAQAMYNYALSQGVPASGLLVDRYGDTTEKSVSNTITLARQYGYESIIATSSFYHMPRIKMLYNLESVDVYTVPTVGDVFGNGTLVSVWREIPAWWFYWFKGSF